MDDLPSEAAAFADRSILNRLVDDLDADSVTIFLSVYLREMVSRVERIVNARECRDWGAVQVEAHALKASSGTYGATRLALWSAAVETACRDGAAETINRLVDDLPRIAAGTRNALAPWSGTETP